MEIWVGMTNITVKYGDMGRDYKYNDRVWRDVRDDKYNGKVWTDG